MDTLDSIVTDPIVFEATVVLVNRGERPVYVEVLGQETVAGGDGFDDRLKRDVREVPPGGSMSLVVDEEMTDLDLRSGVRGFAELTEEDERRYSGVLTPTPPEE